MSLSKQIKLRIHPYTHSQLRSIKFNTQMSMNGLINYILKEALKNESISNKLQAMYIPGESEVWIRDWREEN